jgi:putative SOS response-associated peptidase YedK
MARFGINLPSSSGKKRPPLLNARTDTLRRGSFKTMLANRRCIIPAEGFYEWREDEQHSQATILILVSLARIIHDGVGTRNPYNSRNEIVGTTNKSIDAMPSA